MGCGGGAARRRGRRRGLLTSAARAAASFEARLVSLTKRCAGAAEQSDVPRATRSVIKHAQASSTWALAL